MITLNNYIKTVSNITELERQLLEHIYIEFRNSDYISFILESHSLFPNCDEIVNFIFINIKRALQENENKIFFRKHKITLTLDKFNTDEIYDGNTLVESLMLIKETNNEINTFFDKLVINIELEKTTQLKFSYTPIDSNYNNLTDKIKICTINATLPKSITFIEYKNIIKKQLVHELTHAYEDYNRLRKTEVESLFDIQKHGIYSTAVKKYASDDIAEKTIGLYVYLINKQERNAYLAEFNQILTDNKLFIKKSQDKLIAALSVIKNTEIWQKYNEINDVVKVFDKLPQKAKELIIHHYKDNYNLLNSNIQNSTVIKRFINNWTKMMRDFTQKLSKIIYNFIDTVH